MSSTAMRVAAFLLLLAAPAAGQGSIEERVRDLLGRMTLEEKFWQLFMLPGSLDDPEHDWSNGVFGLQVRDAADARAHAARIDSIQRYFVERTRLGIPMIPFEEALHGFMGPGATVFPQAIGLAATFDTALVGRVSRTIAAETRSRGVRMVLSPVVNIASDVRWGRTEETYGEDPHLASMMARAFVRAFESNGIIATPKHFVANVGDGGRDSYPIELSERALRERHFPPFQAALDEGARSVMTAYNSVDGSPATQNAWLMNEVLKDEWGFGGFVISDASATGGATVLHRTEASTATAAEHALESGLDVIFQTEWQHHRPYLAAFQSGAIPDSVIDAAVARVLRAKLELGLFEDPYPDPDEAVRVNGAAEHIALAREAARASLVLLKNDGVLPLSKDAAAIAVIGPDAVDARLGGYSAPGERRVSILEGIRNAAPNAEVRFAPGPGRMDTTHVVVPSQYLATRAANARVRGLTGEYFANIGFEGEPAVTRIDERIDFGWTLNSPARGVPFDWYSVRWTGSITAPPAGVRKLGIEGNDGYRVWLDGQLIIDNATPRSYGAHLADVNLAPGSTHDVRIEFVESTGNARVKLVWDAGIVDDSMERIREAVDAARASDVAIVVAGIEEGEFRDRAILKLPGRQGELIEAVAATGTPTVVVLVGGSAITMSRWLEDVGAVLMAWYPGEQGGPAIAEILFGDDSPAGRLPTTFPVAEGQLPLFYDHKPTGRGDDYLDLTGMPLFPFGYGVSYTTFEYSNLEITPDTIGPAASARISFTVRNTGERAGDEVAQLYIRDVLASVARPVMQLKAFERIRLEPGEAREITFVLRPEDLAMLDRDLNRVVEPGTFRIMIGASSQDIRLRGHLEVR